MKQRLIYTLAFLFATMQTFAQTYTYDNNNRLTKVVYGNGVTVTYDYDALGNRISKKVTGGSNVDIDSQKQNLMNNVAELDYKIYSIGDELKRKATENQAPELYEELLRIKNDCAIIASKIGNVTSENEIEILRTDLQQLSEMIAVLRRKVTEYLATDNIKFADANVKTICVKNWDTDGDGELSYDEAAAVKDLGQAFYWNVNIKYFDEFQYFTGVETINRDEFALCGNLSSIKFPNSIKNILLQSFACTSLTSINIPKSVISIEPVAFEACEKLASITVEEGNTVYDSRDNCNAIIHTRSNALIVGCKNTVIPASVTAISQGAFDGCTGLTSIEIPSRVTYIAPAAFAGSGLTSITIPKSVSYIGEVAFKSCQNLSSITVEEGNTVYDSRDNCNAIINTKNNVLISGCKSTVIPNTVTAIGKRAFEGHESLTEITIPNSVTSIEDQAFYSTCIESLHIPSSVTTIGSQAFGGCNKLKTITFEKWPESVGSKIVFYGSNSLEKVIILDRQPTAIGNDTFLNHYNGTWTAATLYVPAGTKAIYEATDGWKNFTNIVEIMEQDNINYVIGDDGNLTIRGTLNGEDTKIEIPDTIEIDGEKYVVKLIAADAFKGNTTLESVTIPETIEQIGDRAFAGCTGLKDIYVMAPQPISLSVAAVRDVIRKTDGTVPSQFDGIDFETCVLHVPYGSEQLYREAEGWCLFKNIVGVHSEHDPETPDGIAEVLMARGIKAIYSPNGKKLDKLQKGLNIVVMNDGSVRKVVVK